MNNDKYNNMQTNNKGFTLIELIVVMAIIAVLVLLAAPRFLGYTKDANVTAMIQDTKVLSDAAEMYHVDKGDWPKLDEIDNHGVGGVDELYRLNESELGDSIKNIKGDYGDYGIAINGQYEGQVFHLDGIEDKEGVLHRGHISVNSGIYTEFEIKEFQSQGYRLVATADDLDKVRNDLDGKYIQVADIDLSDYSTGDGWEPIGDISVQFTGTYDGGGYIIENLMIDKEPENHIGLFGRAYGATFRNVGIKNGDIKGNWYVGGLVGHQSNSSVLNSYTTGTIEGIDYVGGLVGSQYYLSAITKSYTTCEVVGKGSIGGLVGHQKNSTTTDSYTTGDINGNNNVGGLIGSQYEMSEVTNSNSTGDIVGKNSVGGLVGYQKDTSSTTSSYATGKVLGSANVGGLIGINDDSSSVMKSYTTGVVNGMNNIGGLVGRNNGSSTVKHSYSDSLVTSSDKHVGGLVGTNSGKSEVKKSYATGTVEGGDGVGGLIGYSNDNAIVSNSYATGNVTGKDSTGGLVGYSNSSPVTNSYATGKVTSNEIYVGGLFGGTTKATVSNSYYDKNTTGQSDSGTSRGLPKSTTEMKEQSTYENWDFDNTWQMKDGEYPTLRWQNK